MARAWHFLDGAERGSLSDGISGCGGEELKQTRFESEEYGKYNYIIIMNNYILLLLKDPLNPSITADQLFILYFWDEVRYEFRNVTVYV